jgi:CRISPR-associated exonuclease Cas4
MFSEDDLLPLSGLQHLAFCERQWALIHLEQQWAENRLTAEGRVRHERVHDETTESRGDTRTVRGLRVHSFVLGLVGMCDVVEFKKIIPSAQDSVSASGIKIGSADDHWLPMPVEHKRGKPKPDRCDEVQLCAQALCLEEMLHVAIDAGAIFYGLPRRRLEVVFDESLREETQRIATLMHELYQIGKTPTAAYEKKCRNCSLLELCKPRVTASPAKSRRYLDNELAELGISSSSEREENK